MNHWKKALSLALALSLCVGLLASCGSTASTDTADTAASETTTATTTEDSQSEADEEVAESTERETHTIVDHSGTEMELPVDIERVVIANILPLPSVYALFDGDAEKLVGMHPTSMAAAENSILGEIMPNILEVSTDFIQDSTINIEELLNLNPDVVFTSTSYPEETAKMREAGIAVVEFSTSNWGYNCVETFENWVLLLGEIFNQEDQAAGIVEYGYEVEAEILSRIEGLSDEDKPKALVLFNYSDSTMSTSGSGFFGQYWFETTGAINVAEELSGSVSINMEQVYEWDPDIIYITNFSSVLPEDLINNTIDGDDWSTVTAVQEGNVYKFPLGMYRWFPPASDTPLVLWWLAIQNQPELFADIDMDAEIMEYYERFYGVTLTEDQLESIYNPAREAAG